MAFFDKKSCGLCGGKVGMMRKLTLSDATLCSDCRNRTSSLVPKSTWKRLGVDDVKRHLAERERNKARFAEFTATSSAGGTARDGGALRLDERRGWFLFATGRDWSNGNPEVFDASAFRGLHIEATYDISHDDADGDGVPDHLQHSRGNVGVGKGTVRVGGGAGIGAARSGGVHGGNLMRRAMNMPFGRYLDMGRSGHDVQGVPREVTGFRFVVELNHPLVNEVSWTDSSMDGRDIQATMMRANQVAELCDRLRAMGGMPPAPGGMPGGAQGYGGMPPGGYPPQGYPQQPHQGQPGYPPQPQQQGQQQGQQPPQQPPQQQGWGAPPAGPGNVGGPGDGGGATTKCAGCGSPMAEDARFCMNCGHPA